MKYLTKTEGFIVKSYDYGEGHRIVVVFTKELGKVRAVAKGSRKIKSKFGASLEPLSENHFLLYRKPEKLLYTVTACKILDARSKLRDDMCLFGYSSLMAEGIDLLCADEDPDGHIYELFKQALDDVEENNPSTSAWLFIFRLLKYTGYRLNFFTCGDCGNKSSGKMYFSPENGGVLCGSCSVRDQLCWPVAYETIKNIKKLSPEGFMARAAEDEVGNIVKKFIKYQFDRDLKSLKFLNLFKRREVKINSKCGN